MLPLYIILGIIIGRIISNYYKPKTKTDKYLVSIVLPLFGAFIIAILLTLPYANSSWFSYKLGGNLLFTLLPGIAVMIVLLIRLKVVEKEDSPQETEESLEIKETEQTVSDIEPSSESEGISREDEIEQGTPEIETFSETDEKEENVVIENKVENVEEIPQEALITEKPIIESSLLSNSDSIPTKSIEVKQNSFPKRKRKWWLWVIAFVIVFMLAAFAYISLKPSPDYVQGFKSKFRYHLGLPNNELAESFIGQADALYNHKGDCLIQKGKNVEYRSLDEIIKNLSNLDSYDKVFFLGKMVKAEEIVPEKTYSRYDISYKIYSGETLLDHYDELSKFLINEVRIVENMKESLLLERKLIENAANIPTKGIKIVERISDYYWSLGKTNNVVDAYKKSLKYNHRNPDYLSHYACALYNNNEFEAAIENAYRSIKRDPKNLLALEIAAKSEARKDNWETASIYAKKALDYDSEDRGIYVIYAKALFEKGEKEDARTYYNLGRKKYGGECDFYNWEDKFEDVGGCPIDVFSLEVGFTDGDGKLLTAQDERLLSSKSMYISPIIRCELLRGGSFVFNVNIFKERILSRADNSSGFTYSQEIETYGLGKRDLILGGWGNDKRGTWPAGNYKCEVWYKGDKIAEKYFNIY